MVSPSQLKRVIGRIDNRFNNSEPQDAHELLVFLLEKLKEMPGEAMIDVKFAGTLRSLMRCFSCSSVSGASQEINCLSLKLSDQGRQSLSDILEVFFSEEVIPLEEKWICGQCSKVSEGGKQLVLEENPLLLLLQLARFSFQEGVFLKNECEVGVPEFVGISGSTYRLVGVVRHTGSRKSGHYTAQIQSRLGWQLCDDDRVTRSQRQPMEWCRSAYLLVYEYAA